MTDSGAENVEKSQPSHTADDPNAQNAAQELQTVRCTSCRADVVPNGKGHCPLCGRFLPANAVAVTHGARRRRSETQSARREEILSLLIAERGGLVAIDTLLLITLEDYATAAAQLESVAAHLEQRGAMTDKGRRRSAVDVYKTFSERVDRLGAEIRGEAMPDSAPRPGLQLTPTPALELAHSLLSRLGNGETLSERELGQLDVLQASMQGTVALPDVPEPQTPRDAFARDPVRTFSHDERCDEPPSVETRAAESAEPPNDAEALARWRLVHANEPAEVDRRNREATAVMFHQIGKPSPWQ